MSVECQCGRKTDLFLCGRCGDDLQDILTGLATGVATNPETGYSRPMSGQIEFLEDAVHGLTRMGMSARRSSEHSSPMPCTLGPKGDFKDSPSDLWDDLNSLLTHWVVAVNVATETLAGEAE